MYIPKYAEQTDVGLLCHFINSYPFGTLVTIQEARPSADHLPFLLEGQDLLWTHVARGNPQWKTLRANPQALVIFQGPHTYVSPSEYSNPLNVPTWNYTAVHAYCRAELIEDPDEIESLLQRLVLHFEKTRVTPWKYELPADFTGSLVRAIVGVKFRIERLEGKFKLSQNRDKEDYDSVVQNLQSLGNERSRELLTWMKLTNHDNLESCP